MKQSKWISVKDRLPEDNIVFGSPGVFNHYREFLVYNGFEVKIGYYRTPINVGDKDENFKPFWSGEDGWYDYSRVTHWQPLPEPPEET